jgi:hypothetical protein
LDIGALQPGFTQACALFATGFRHVSAGRTATDGDGQVELLAEGVADEVSGKEVGAVYMPAPQ